MHRMSWAAMRYTSPSPVFLGFPGIWTGQCLNSFACIFADGCIPNPNFEILDAAVVVIALFSEGGCTWESLQGAHWSNRTGTCKGKWNFLRFWRIVPNNWFWNRWNRRSFFLERFFFPAQLISWYGILGIFVVIPPDRIAWPRAVTSSRPRRSSFWDQDLGRFVGW